MKRIINFFKNLILKFMIKLRTTKSVNTATIPNNNDNYVIGIWGGSGNSTSPYYDYEKLKKAHINTIFPNSWGTNGTKNANRIKEIINNGFKVILGANGYRYIEGVDIDDKGVTHEYSYTMKGGFLDQLKELLTPEELSKIVGIYLQDEPKISAIPQIQEVKNTLKTYINENIPELKNVPYIVNGWGFKASKDKFGYKGPLTNQYNIYKAYLEELSKVSDVVLTDTYLSVQIHVTGKTEGIATGIGLTTGSGSPSAFADYYRLIYKFAKENNKPIWQWNSIQQPPFESWQTYHLYFDYDPNWAPFVKYSTNLNLIFGTNSLMNFEYGATNPKRGKDMFKSFINNEGTRNNIESVLNNNIAYMLLDSEILDIRVYNQLERLSLGNGVYDPRLNKSKTPEYLIKELEDLDIKSTSTEGTPVDFITYNPAYDGTKTVESCTKKEHPSQLVITRFRRNGNEYIALFNMGTYEVTSNVIIPEGYYIKLNNTYCRLTEDPNSIPTEIGKVDPETDIWPGEINIEFEDIDKYVEDQKINYTISGGVKEVVNNNGTIELKPIINKNQSLGFGDVKIYLV